MRSIPDQLWQFAHGAPTSTMDTQPPPDQQVSELQELMAAYRRVIAGRDYQHLLTLHLLELVDIYGFSVVEQRLAGVGRNMGLSVSGPGDPRR